MEQNRVVEACQKFAESVALLRRGGALLNLAVCSEREGHYATALPLLMEARELALEDGRADRVALAEAHIGDVRTRVSWLTVRPSPGAAALELAIECDGQDLGRKTWGTPRAVDPGAHTVVATAPAHVPFRASVVLGPAGDEQTLEVPPLAEERFGGLPKAAAAPPDARALTTTAAAPAWKSPLGWTALGVGLAAIAVGSAFGVESIVDSNMSKSQCVDNICGSAGYQKNRAARTEADVADVAIPAGVVAAGAGLYMLLKPLFAARRAPQTRAATGSESPAGEEPARWRLSVLVGSANPDWVWISLQSRW